MKHYPGVSEPAGRTFGEEEARALAEVLASAKLNFTVGGLQAPSLENEFAAMLGLDHAVACSSGTAAVHLAVGAVDPAPGDEIITSPLTDFGTIIPILAQNAVPVFADVDPRDGNLDPTSVEALISERTRAIIAVHLFGAAAPVDILRDIADGRGITLIEDCAQAYLTALPDGRLAGTVGHAGCFSLQQSKHITCGDGGLAVSADRDFATAMRLFADKGWPRHTGERTHVSYGLNYRMTELQAAVARAQLPKLPGVVARRRRTARRLADALRPLPGLSVPADVDRHAVWLFPVVVDDETAGGDNRAYGAALAAEGVPVITGYLSRPVYDYPVLTQRKLYGGSGFPFTSPPARKEFRYGPGLCPRAEHLIDRTLLVVQWNEAYTDADVDEIAAAFGRVHADLRPRELA